MRVPFDIPPFTLVNLTIKNLKNPDKEGGTPSIKILTLCKDFLVNSNEAFAQVALLPKPLWLPSVHLELKSNISSAADSVAGALNSYIFK